MASRKKGRTSKSDPAGQAIHRLWGDVEVVDAEKDLRVFISEIDIEKATRKDPACCVFAQACKRMFSSSRVMFFKRIAYVELPDKDGTVHVERFVLPPEMRSLVESFDRGEVIIPKAGFLLKAPSAGRTFEKQRKQKQKQTEKRRKGILGTAEPIGEQGKGKTWKKPIVIDMEVRSGTGAVHFTTKGKGNGAAN